MHIRVLRDHTVKTVISLLIFMKFGCSSNFSNSGQKLSESDDESLFDPILHLKI